MSLLTKEQLQIVNGIKAMIADYDYKTDQIRGLFDLVSIIDDLQARVQTQADIGEKWLEATPEQVKDELQRGFHNGGDWEPDAIIRAHQLIGKQYTEQEIMEMCRIDPSICADGATCDGAIWFACMTGALKAEP